MGICDFKRLESVITWSERSNSPLNQELEGLIIGDSRVVLPELPTNYVDLIHTSPPYNIEKPYSASSDDLHHVEYMNLLRTVFQECFRILKPNASLFLQSGYSQNQSAEVLPIDILTYEMMHDLGFVLWDRIVWHYRGGLSFSKKFKNTHETILWWVKPSSSKTFQPYFAVDEVREASISYDKRNNLFGKNPGNVWVEDRVAFGGRKRETSHVAVYPESITERLIRACSRPGEMVLDPFSGSGTTPALARALGRRWIGIEVSPKYANESLQRLKRKQSCELATLASAVLKRIAFGEKTGKYPLHSVTSLLQNWLNAIDIKKYFEIMAENLNADELENISKTRIEKNLKSGVWSYFDQLFKSDADSIQPLLMINSLIDEEYPQRSRWNNVRKFLHSLELLTSLSRYANDCISELLFNVIECETGSYVFDHGSNSIEFFPPQSSIDFQGRVSFKKSAKSSSLEKQSMKRQSSKGLGLDLYED